MLRPILILLTLLCSANTFAGNHDLQWARGAVWYQIFPERFRNGSIENDPVKARVVGERDWDWQVHPWTSDWYALQPWEQQRNEDFYEMVFDRRYGGDLVGVIEKLDYLHELGVDVIYFNPVFEAPSLHKYDASSYHHIDNNFGRNREGDWRIILNETNDPKSWTFTNADSVFLTLIKQAHHKGMRVVIDGVFNHCGTQFWAFQDIVAKQQESKYAGWFDVKRWDDPTTPGVDEFDYHGWWDYKGLPEFREDNKGLVAPVREYFFSITRRWMDPNGDGDPADGIDGWRLDVANEVNPLFWEDWQTLVKSINPAAITVGEIWGDAAEWVGGKRFDITMNYPVAKAVVDFFADRATQTSATEFGRELARVRSLYSERTNLLMMNLVDGHDTDRMASMIMNPDRNYDRQAGVRANPDYNPVKPDETARKIHKLITLFQMTYIGSPMIYYGDEAGMWGGDDPDDRKPMIWPDLKYEDETYTAVLPHLKARDEVKFDSEMFTYYKKLISMRHQNTPLRVGSIETVLEDNDRQLYGFLRIYDGEQILILLNNSASTEVVEISVDWPGVSQAVDLLSEKKYGIEQGVLNLTLDPFAGAILKKK